MLALTVDHGLHPDSAGWTEAAGVAARRIGVDWRPLWWSGDKPTTGLPEAARLARHRLLADAARAAGARVILLGHTADDVAEGERMRMRDVPALGRLREWGPSPVWPEGRGLFLLRPLLQVGRAPLRAWLTAEGWGWHDDPANEDTRYARTRARLNPSPLGGEGRGSPDASAGSGATVLPSMGGEGPRPLAQGDSGFSVTLDGRILAPRMVTPAFLSAALLCAAGGEAPPRGERLERLLERLAAGGPLTASLAGARVEAEGSTLVIGREAGERARGGLAETPLARGVPAVWDGRFLVEAEVEGLSAAPLAGRMNNLSRNDRIRLKAYPAAARSALPVLSGALGAALPRPFGDGPGTAACLVRDRLFAACGLISSEHDLLS